ncbi:MAG: glycosyltransferase, partial [Desulfobulbaceae bacterium]|nr:glycosyltransferase [Desulfobulbaceae bacterium]
MNSAAYLEQTIDSVARQNYPNIEYIVVDGGSTDRTIDIIKKHEAQIDKWISEPDHGIADAMNKGLAMASGDYILFLHSDDYLVGESAISNASQHLTHGKDIVFCSIYLEKNGTQRPHRPRGFNWWMNFKSGVYHQSAICARSLFFKIGPFDKGFRIAMAYAFF